MSDRNGWRPLSERERALLAHLLSFDFVGRDALNDQLQAALVSQIASESGLAFRTAGPSAQVKQRVPVEGRYIDGPLDAGGASVEVLLHVVDGRMTELEVYKVDGSPILTGPFDIDPTDVEVWAA